MSGETKLDRALQRLENIRGPDRAHYVRRLREALDKLRASDELDKDLEERVLLEVIRIEQRAQGVSQRIAQLTDKLAHRQLWKYIGKHDDDE